MMIDIRPVIINGWVALRLLCAGFSVRIKKDLPKARPKPLHWNKLKVWWSKYCSGVVDYEDSRRTGFLQVCMQLVSLIVSFIRNRRFAFIF